MSNTEIKYEAPKAKMFVVVTFVEKHRAFLGSKLFKLRIDIRALSWHSLGSLAHWTKVTSGDGY